MKLKFKSIMIVRNEVTHTNYIIYPISRISEKTLVRYPYSAKSEDKYRNFTKQL
jgi:hypothetical protein